MKARILTHVLLMFVSLAGVSLASSSLSNDSDYTAISSGRLLDMAEERYFDGDVATALEILDQLLQRDNLPLDEKVGGHLLEAYCYTAMQMEGPAKRAIRNAWKVRNELEVDPDVVPPRFMWHYYDVMKELGVDKPINTIAVLYFTNNSVTDHDALDPLSQGVADMVQVGLLNVDGITIVERERIEYILKELELEQSEAFGRKAAGRLGKQLGVRYLLLGGFTRIEDRVRLTCRVVRTETGEILGTESVEGKWKDMMEHIDAVGLKSVGIIKKVMPIEIKKWDSGHVDPEALLRYSEGLVLMEYGKYTEARSNFLAAQEIAPGFEKAEHRVRQLTAVASLEEGARRVE